MQASPEFGNSLYSLWLRQGRVAQPDPIRGWILWSVGNAYCSLHPGTSPKDYGDAYLAGFAHLDALWASISTDAPLALPTAKLLLTAQAREIREIGVRLVGALRQAQTRK